MPIPKIESTVVETPAEHIRNALQLLTGETFDAKWLGGPPTLTPQICYAVRQADMEAARARLLQALAQLEGTT